MWISFSISLIILVAEVVSLDQNVIQLSVDYFNYREVKTVCLFTCNNHWSYRFTKTANENQISVSKVHIDGTQNELKVIKCLNKRFTSVAVLIDSKCVGYEDVMKFASLNKMFDSMHRWLIIDDDFEINAFINTTAIIHNTTNDIEVKVSKALTTVENLNTSVDSDIVFSFHRSIKHNELNMGTGNEEFYNVTELFDFVLCEAFNFGKIQGGNLSLNCVASWSNDKGLIMLENLNSYKYYRRWNFQQWGMRMILVFANPPKHFDPDMIIGRTAAPGVARITQTPTTLLHVIAEVHNFRFVYTLAERWIESYKAEETKVVASALHYGYQDVSPCIRMPYVVDKIDLVHPPATSIETRYYYRIPTYGPGKFENQFLRPLTTGAWFCALAVISLCALALLLGAKLEQHPMPVQYAAFSVCALSCQQFFQDSGDNRTKIKSQARQIVVFVTGISCVLIHNYYTSSVVSWLLNGPPPSINSLEELLNSPLELILEDIGYTRSWVENPDYYFNKKNAEIEDAMRQQKVYKKKKGAPLLISIDEGIEMVKAGGFAFHAEVDNANELISRKFDQMELCELGSLHSMEKASLYVAIQQNSPYKEFLVWSLSRLSERGITSCIQHRTSSNPVSCGGSSPRALALGGAAPAFLMLAFGYILASLILLLERVIHKRISRKLH